MTAALVDLAGDDQYTSGGQCGHNGVGFFLDQSGHDTYTTGDLGTNGGRYLGSGSSWTNPATTPTPQAT